MPGPLQAPRRCRTATFERRPSYFAPSPGRLRWLPVTGCHEQLVIQVCSPPVLQPAAWLGASWQAAAVAGAAAAGALALLHALLAVQWESLTYVRLLGVRLEARRRCGLGGSSLFLPLRTLQGLIIHEVSGQRAAGWGLLVGVCVCSLPCLECAARQCRRHSCAGYEVALLD